MACTPKIRGPKSPDTETHVSIGTLMHTKTFPRRPCPYSTSLRKEHHAHMNWGDLRWVGVRSGRVIIQVIALSRRMEGTSTQGSQGPVSKNLQWGDGTLPALGPSVGCPDPPGSENRPEAVRAAHALVVYQLSPLERWGGNQELGTEVSGSHFTQHPNSSNPGLSEGGPQPPRVIRHPKDQLGGSVLPGKVWKGGPVATMLGPSSGIGLGPSGGPLAIFAFQRETKQQFVT